VETRRRRAAKEGTSGAGLLVAGAALVGLLLCSVTDVPRRAELSPFSLRKRH
jgi:hypothetical protein